MTKSKEVATVEEPKYPIAVPGSDVAAALAENLGGESLSAFDLQRVKIPSGGITSWVIDDIDGEEIAKTFNGIIVFHKLARSYWSEDIDDGGSGNPPDCSSSDCVTGIGEPGGECETCEYAQFGSAHKGEGQACKMMRQLFVVREGELLPLVLNVAPSSLKQIKSYLLRLAAKGRPYYSVVTEFSLVKKQNKGGTDYAEVHFSVAGTLTPDETQAVAEYVKGIRGSLERVRD